MSEAQEVVTVGFKWDTSDADAGAKRIEQAMARVQAAIGNAGKPRTSKAGANGHGGGDSNFAMGIRDLSEGRGVNAMQRFGHSIGATAGALASYMVLLKATGAVLGHVRGEVEKTGSASRGMATDFTARTRLMAFSTKGETPDVLSGKIQSLREGYSAENEHQVGLQRASEMMGALKTAKLNPIAWAAHSAIEAYNDFQGNRTPEEEEEASEKRGRVYEADVTRVTGLRRGAYSDQVDIAKSQGMGGNPFDAKRKELDLQKEIEISNAKASGATNEDVENVSKRYEILRKTISEEESGARESLVAEHRLTNARKMGFDEVGTAYVRLYGAQQEKEKAIGEIAKKSAANKVESAEVDLEIAKRSVALRQRAFEIDYAAAKFRGNDEQQAVIAADAEQERARAKVQSLDASKSATVEERQQAALALEQANTNRVMLERQLSVARLRVGGAGRVGAMGLIAAAGTTGMGNEPSHRAALEANVSIAKDELAVANAVAEVQKHSLESIEGQHRAVERVAAAQLQLKQHVIETQRVRAIEVNDSQFRNASSRLQSIGRGDIAGLQDSRHATSEGAYNAIREGNPALAAMLQEGQRTRESGMAMDKYLTPDGHRRRAVDIHRDERELRNTARRRGRFADNLEANGGLRSVHRDMNGNAVSGIDPITGQHDTIAGIHRREAAPGIRAEGDKSESAQDLKNIYQVLATRLPAASS